MQSSPIRRTLFRSLIVLGLVLGAAGLLTLFGVRAQHSRLRLSRLEVFAIFCFAGAVGALALAALRAGFLLLRSALSPTRLLYRSQRAIAVFYSILGAALVACVLYARYVEPFRLTVHHQTVPLPDLAAPLRFVVFSDVHSDARFPNEDHLVDLINQQEPDVIVFLGDALNKASRAAIFRDTMARLRAPVKLAIRGNWDVWYWWDIDLFAETGFSEIESGWHPIDVHGIPLRVGGHAFVDAWAPRSVLPAPPPGPGPAIFLYHAADYAHVAAERGISLYLDGDTHGGQIAVPLYGALLSIGRRGREFTRGLYHVGKATVVVTPGIGVERGFPFRFVVPPEITVLDLIPAADS